MPNESDEKIELDNETVYMSSINTYNKTALLNIAAHLSYHVVHQKNLSGFGILMIIPMVQTQGSLHQSSLAKLNRKLQR